MLRKPMLQKPMLRKPIRRGRAAALLIALSLTTGCGLSRASVLSAPAVDGNVIGSELPTLPRPRSTGTPGSGTVAAPPDEPPVELVSVLLTFGDPLLQSVYEELAEQSPTLRTAMASLAARMFVVRIGDFGELAALNLRSSPGRQLRPSPRAIGVTAYSPDPDGTVTTAFVAIAVDRLHDLSRERPESPVDSARARQLIRDTLIHELFGHLVPIGLAGHVHAAVPDPGRGEPYELSAVGMRENRIRRELGLPPRVLYALNG